MPVVYKARASQSMYWCFRFGRILCDVLVFRDLLSWRRNWLIPCPTKICCWFCTSVHHYNVCVCVCRCARLCARARLYVCACYPCLGSAVHENFFIYMIKCFTGQDYHWCNRLQKKTDTEIKRKKKPEILWNK